MEDTIKDRIEAAKALDLRDVALRMGLTLGKGGKTLFCPTGHGRGPGRGTASAGISVRGGVGLWFCHSCGAGGSVVDLVMAAQETDLLGAVEWLSGPLPDRPAIAPTLDPLDEETAVTLSDRVAAFEAFMGPLTLGEAGRAWLEGRGFDPAAAEAAGIVDTTARGEEAFGSAVSAVGRDVVIALGLGQARERDGALYNAWTGGRNDRAKWLIWPYRGPDGRVSHMQGRNMTESGRGPRWRHPKGQVPLPWGLDLCADAGRVWVVEGCTDALALYQRGRYAIGLPGTSWLRPAAAKRLAAWGQGKAFVVALDSDAAGREATPKVAGMLRDAGADVLEVEWPEGYEGDWCDWLAERETWPGIRKDAEDPEPPALPAAATTTAAAVPPLSYEQIRDYDGRGKRCTPPPVDVFLTRTKTTRAPHPSSANVRSVLADDPRLASAWWYDEVFGRVRWGDAEVSDAHYVAVKTWLDAAYGLRVSTSAVAEQVAVLAEQNSRDVIRDYLDGLAWDGVPRVSRWLPDLFGAADTPLHREYGRCWMVGCVARAMSPGCKLDTVLVLVGPQGVRKSTAMRALVGDDWYSDTGLDLESKDALMRFEGSWVVELGEMSGYHKARQDAVKALLSSQVDVYRRPYARELVRVPRRAVLIGTENRISFLNDETGNRRWWPVRVTKADPEKVAAVREQLWAEAVHLWRSGAQWYLDADGSNLQADSAERFSLEEPWSAAVLGFMDGRRTATTGDILDRALQIDTERQDQRAAKRVAAILRQEGWEQVYDRDSNGKTRRIWCKA